MILENTFYDAAAIVWFQYYNNFLTDDRFLNIAVTPMGVTKIVNSKVLLPHNTKIMFTTLVTGGNSKVHLIPYI